MCTLKYDTKFEVKLPSVNKWCSGQGNKIKVRDTVSNTSKDCCMYCGNSVVTDNYNFGQIEHAVEKSQRVEFDLDTCSEKVLKNYTKKTSHYRSDIIEHCKYNLGLACPQCNMSLKKAKAEVLYFENKPLITENKDFSKHCMSINSECDNQPCEYMQRLRKSHFDINSVLLMPYGIELDGSYNHIYYDLKAKKYIPRAELSEYNKSLVNNHIAYFKLNQEDRGRSHITFICRLLLATKSFDLVEQYLNSNRLHILACTFSNKLKRLCVSDAIEMCKVITEDRLERNAVTDLF